VDVGTYDWCAPEIILYQQATVKSDIFSYGVVMWEIITGKPPSRGRITDVV
jgi:serine/threonine protein kinase